MVEFRWQWAGHVSRQVIRAGDMDELMGKVAASLRKDLGVRTPTATLMNYVRRLAEEHNGAPTGVASGALR
jgi:hypothetical protein